VILGGVKGPNDPTELTIIIPECVFQVNYNIKMAEKLTMKVDCSNFSISDVKKYIME